MWMGLLWTQAESFPAGVVQAALPFAETLQHVSLGSFAETFKVFASA